MQISKDLINIFEKYGHDVLGLFNLETIDEILESQIEDLIFERAKAREAKDWVKSDSIRDKLKHMGIEIQDTPDGAKWRRI